jgi:hypothetical protein
MDSVSLETIGLIDYYLEKNPKCDADDIIGGAMTLLKKEKPGKLVIEIDLKH